MEGNTRKELGFLLQKIFLSTSWRRIILTRPRHWLQSIQSIKSKVYYMAHLKQMVIFAVYTRSFMEDFIRQSLLPLTVPINTETHKMLNDDNRKIVLAILEDDSDENSSQLVKILRSAANANRDLVFGYVGVKQWEEFVETFDVSKSSQLPKLLVWDRNEEYELVEGSERLEEGDQASQISQFLEGYRAGRTTKKKVSGPSFVGFLDSLVSMNSLYILIFVVALLFVCLS